MANGITPIGNGCIRQKCTKINLPDVGRVNLVANAKYFSNQRVGEPYFEITKGSKTIGTVLPKKGNRFSIQMSNFERLNFKGAQMLETVEIQHALINLNKKMNLSKLLENFCVKALKVIK